MAGPIRPKRVYIRASERNDLYRLVGPKRRPLSLYKSKSNTQVQLYLHILQADHFSFPACGVG